MALPLPERLPLDTRNPFSRAESRAAGLAVSALYSGRYRRLFRDRYVVAEVPVTLALRARTALDLAAPGSWISHHSAARLWGAVVPDVLDIHLTVPDERPRTRVRGIRSHRAAEGAVPATLRGLPVSTPTALFCELAAHGLELIDLVVLGDSLVKARRVSPRQLVEAAGRWSGPNARRARRAARLVRDGVDSPMETRLRLLLVLAGLPEPVANHIIRSGDGEWRMRFDLCYEAVRVIVEYDGRQHADSAEQWHRDLTRREELDHLGWRIIVVTGHDLYTDPLAVLVRVRDALRDRGAHVRTTFKPEWELHFGRPA